MPFIRHSHFLFILLFSLFGLSACQSQPEGDIWPLISDCDLHKQACQSSQNQSTVTLNLQPKPIPIAKSFQVEVELAGLQADKLELDISGINMYMGYNRITLQHQGDGKYTGQSMLAFCTNEVMQWQLTLLAHQPNQVIQIPFQLETQNR